jgi:hypothetical protein
MLHLSPSDNEMIVFAVASPRAGRHIADLNKLPISHVDWRKAEIIVNGW